MVSSNNEDRRPLVHVGMAKAASTFLQSRVLSRLGDDFLYIGKNGPDPELNKTLTSIVRLTSVQFDEASTRNAIAVYVSGRPAAKIIYSEEDCSVFKFLDPLLVADRLKTIFGPYDTLLIIRSPVTWVHSQYFFRLSTYHPSTLNGIDAWYEHHSKSVGIGSDLTEIRFARLAKLYRERCGGTCTVLPYELLGADPAAFVRGLAAATGAPEDALRELVQAERSRRRDKGRISAGDAAFIKQAHLLLEHRFDEFWDALNASLGNLDAVPDQGAYGALEQLYRAREPDFGVWKPVLSKLRFSILKDLERDEAGDEEVLSPRHTARLQQIAALQAAELKRDFGIDLERLVPGAYQARAERPQVVEAR